MEILIKVLVIVFCSLVVFANIGVFIYKKIKHIPTGDCGYCSKGVKKLVKDYHKFYKNNNDNN